MRRSPSYIVLVDSGDSSRAHYVRADDVVHFSSDHDSAGDPTGATTVTMRNGEQITVSDTTTELITLLQRPLRMPGNTTGRFVYKLQSAVSILGA